MFKKLTVFVMAVFASSVLGAAEVRLVPNSIADADRNAEVIVAMSNAGKKIDLYGNTYYVGASKSKLYQNLYIKGPGTIITTTGDNFYINASISIIIVGVTIKLQKPFQPELRIGLS